MQIGPGNAPGPFFCGLISGGSAIDGGRPNAPQTLPASHLRAALGPCRPRLPPPGSWVAVSKATILEIAETRVQCKVGLKLENFRWTLPSDFCVRCFFWVLAAGIVSVPCAQDFAADTTRSDTMMTDSIGVTPELPSPVSTDTVEMEEKTVRSSSQDSLSREFRKYWAQVEKAEGFDKVREQINSRDLDRSWIPHLYFFDSNLVVFPGWFVIRKKNRR